MKQKRCPRCGKRRRYVEGGGTKAKRDREAHWVRNDGQWICRYCVPDADLSWRQYHGDREIAEHPLGFVVIRSIDRNDPIPLCCPQCSYVLRSRDDEEAFLEHQVCEHCLTHWVYPNRDRWDNGWRPSPEEVAGVSVTRSPLSITFVVD